MPSVLEQARKDGLDALLADGGEKVTFRNKSFIVLIDRNAGSIVPRRRGEPTFVENYDTVIEIGVDLLTTPPESGEIFTEPNGTKHRIQRVARLGLTWSCRCPAKVA